VALRQPGRPSGAARSRQSAAATRRQSFIGWFANRHDLSPRQAEALSLAAGETYAGIAVRMGVKESTVKTHVGDVLARSKFKSVKAILISEWRAASQTLRVPQTPSRPI